MGLVKFYYGAKLPASPNNNTLYFLNSGELYKGATLIADVTDTIAIQSMIDDAIGGIGKAVRFIGHSSTALTDGGNEIPTIDGAEFVDIEAGDVVFYDNKEFICTVNGKWELFGDEGSYATIAAFDELVERVNKIVAGNVQVESAKKADSATEAIHAVNADEATHADSANTAIQANQALIAGEAHYAATADKASHAETAGQAVTANYALNAKDAEAAETALTAGFATTAESANSALFATEADFASSAESATKANALNLVEASGSSTKPVYFTADGIPAPITHTIEASVPSDAKFTDTVSAIASTTGDGNAITDISVSNGQFTITKGSKFALDDDLQSLISALTWTTV